jgi:hypothetical protein
MTDSSNNQRLDELEFRLHKLHEIVVDPKRSHFNHVIIDYSLSKNETNKIYGFMDEAYSKLSEKLISLDDLRLGIYGIVPRLKGEEHFVISAIRALQEDGRYPELYKELQI